jgi:hypothetical protein
MVTFILLVECKEMLFAEGRGKVASEKRREGGNCHLRERYGSGLVVSRQPM